MTIYQILPAPARDSALRRAVWLYVGEVLDCGGGIGMQLLRVRNEFEVALEMNFVDANGRRHVTHVRPISLQAACGCNLVPRAMRVTATGPDGVLLELRADSEPVRWPQRVAA